MQGTPLLSVLGQPLNGPPGVMEDLELPFYSSTTGVLGSPWFLLLLWCPVKGFVRDVADPSPLPSHDDGAHAVLVAADGLGPEY